ncbi:AAA family ATPase [Cytobacillus oceanisediminis]|uniref:AAA family ATPase n=1 Tax=Cytobacillus oceanisediminis TaxID=665099 RepID=UPI00249511FE|nr:AAA family ATPase [Cytobacillus oceanisediminis]
MYNNVIKHLPNIIRASFEGDKRTVELAAMSIIRKIKKEDPSLSEELAKILTTYGAGAPLTRSLGIDPPPTDKETFLSLVKISDNSDHDEELILSDETKVMVDRFIKERQLMSKLLSNGISPPKSILLYGPPGVGKTMLAKVLSKHLDLPLITLDLASTVSSYLGKTGQNLKKVLEYAKSSPSILFLDEFDAIAKRRDDPTDLGELKRIVNVLLKELEDWPHNSIFVAATNHSEFLDKAIWRRFDIKIEIGLPKEEDRLRLWKEYLFRGIIDIPEDFLVFISRSIENISPADIKQISEKVLREVLVENLDPKLVLIRFLKETYSNIPNFNKLVILELKRSYGKKITQAQIAEILGISVSTVNHHLKSTSTHKNNVKGVLKDER